MKNSISRLCHNGRVAYTLPAGKVSIMLIVLWVFASIGMGVFVYGLYEIIVNDATI